MLKHFVVAAAFAACLAAPADARDGAQDTVAAPPVDTLSCEQMQGEMITAGQLMQSQMDPNLGADIEAMQATAAERQRGAMSGAVGAGLICAVPGLGMACVAAQQAQANQQMAHAAEDQAQRDHVIGSMNNSIAGIDQERMMALNNRWESQRCESSQPQMQ